MKKIALGIFILIMLAPASLVRAGEDFKRNLLLAEGSAEVSAENDSGMIWATVVTENKSLERAGSENAARTKKVMAAVQGLKIKNLKLETTRFQVSPVREHSGRVRDIIGYRVSNSVQVTLEGVAAEKLALQVSELIGAALESGANSIGNVRFYLKNKDEVEKQALSQATKKAMAQAKVMAQAAGVKLKRIARLSSQPQHVPQARGAFRGAGLELKAAAMAPPVEVGESTVRAQVSVAYEIE